MVTTCGKASRKKPETRKALEPAFAKPRLPIETIRLASIPNDGGAEGVEAGVCLSDVVTPSGALVELLPGRFVDVPLYWQHDPARRIGTIESVGEDERGLRIIADTIRESALGDNALGAIYDASRIAITLGLRLPHFSQLGLGRRRLSLHRFQLG